MDIVIIQVKTLWKEVLLASAPIMDYHYLKISICNYKAGVEFHKKKIFLLFIIAELYNRRDEDNAPYDRYAPQA